MLSTEEWLGSGKSLSRIAASFEQKTAEYTAKIITSPRCALAVFEGSYSGQPTVVKSHQLIEHVSKNKQLSFLSNQPSQISFLVCIPLKFQSSGWEQGWGHQVLHKTHREPQQTLQWHEERW